MVGRKENNQLLPETTNAQVDLALNRNSNNPVANSAASACLIDGIGGTDEKFRFGTDGQGNYGYIKKVEGADTFVPFKGAVPFTITLYRNSYGKSDGSMAKLLGLPISDYKKLTVASNNSATTISATGYVNGDSTAISFVNNIADITPYDTIDFRVARSYGTTSDTGYKLTFE